MKPARDDLAFGRGDDLEDGLGGAAFLLGGDGLPGSGSAARQAKAIALRDPAPELLVGGQAALEEEQVGVDLRGAGQPEEAHFDARLEGHGKEPQGGLLAGRVAVEEALDLRMVAAQERQLALRDGGALGGDRGLEAHLPAAQGVELALDQDERVARRPTAVRARSRLKSRLPLVKIGRLGRIDVLCLPGRIVLRGERGLAGGEGDDPALVVADRDHQPAAEARAEDARRSARTRRA